jgi:hypothetical protein
MAWTEVSYTENYSCLSTDIKKTTGIPEGAILAEAQPEGSDPAVKFYKFLQGDWRLL